MRMTEDEGVDGECATLKLRCGSAQVLLPASFLRGRITSALFLDDGGSAEKDGFLRFLVGGLTVNFLSRREQGYGGHLEVDAHKEIGGSQDRDQGSWTHNNRVDG